MNLLQLVAYINEYLQYLATFNGQVMFNSNNLGSAYLKNFGGT